MNIVLHTRENKPHARWHASQPMAVDRWDQWVRDAFVYRRATEMVIRYEHYTNRWVIAP